VSRYHIWAWIDRTTEDFVAVVAAVPDNGGEAEVISLSEISPDDRAARLRLDRLVAKVKASILARGGEVLDVTMATLPPTLGLDSCNAGRQPEALVLAEVADVHRRDRTPCGFRAYAGRLDRREPRRHGLVERRDGRRSRNQLPGTAPIHRHRD
jgi:hypothetical protein